MHVGYRRQDGVWTQQYASSIGPCNAMCEYCTGWEMARLLDRHGMVATNTFFPTAPTYYRDTAWSYIDFIFVPKSMLARVKRLWVNIELGKSIQLTPHKKKTRRLIDHMPVQMILAYRRWFDANVSEPQEANYNRDAIMLSLNTGFRRAEFLEKVENTLQVGMLRCNTGNVDGIWTCLENVVHEAASQFRLQPEQFHPFHSPHAQ